MKSATTSAEGGAFADTPYDDLLERLTLPTMPELVRASAVLGAYEGRLPGGIDPEEIAFAEFAYYIEQTHAYEVVGYEILGEMSACTSSEELVSAFARQAVDEANHVFAYERLRSRLFPQDAGSRSSEQEQPQTLEQEQSQSSEQRQGEPARRQVPWRGDVRRLGEALLGRGALPEKAVRAFCVLESLAVGIFSARHRAYRDSAIANLDHRIVTEEARHQRAGTAILRSFVEAGELSPRDLNTLVRESAELVAKLLEPRDLLEWFDLGTTPADLARLQGAGFLCVQREVTRRAIGNSMRAVLRAVPMPSDAPRERAQEPTESAKPSATAA